jgi:hypothetical protein
VALQHAYSTANLLTGLAASSFTLGTAVTTNRAYLNDGKMYKQFAAGAASSGTTLIIDLGSSQAFNVAAILNSNIAEATAPTLKVERADDLAFTSNVATLKSATTLNTTEPRHKDHVLQFTSVTKRYVKFTWTWTGSFNLRFGEVWIGASTALSRFSILGANAGDEEKIIGSRTEFATGELGGHFVAGPIRIKRIPLADLSESEKNEVMTMWRAARGHVRPVLWCHQYETGSTAADNDHQECVLGKIEQDGISWNEFDYGRYNIEPGSLVIRSLAREIGS